MLTRTTVALMIFCSGLIMSGSLRAGDVDSVSATKLASCDWSLKASPNLMTKPFSEELIVNFLNAIDVSHGGIGDFGGSEDDDANEHICSFTFANMRRNGNLSLIVGGGSNGCRDVYIIDRDPSSGFQTYVSEGDLTAGEDISGKIKDLRHDGSFELLLPVGPGDNRCGGTWRAIFAWTGDDYSDVSDKFKDYYRQRLESLNSELGKVAVDPDKKECLEAEAAKLKRYLGISPQAGLDQAIRLGKSDDWRERGFAVDILADIGTPEAREHLKTLSTDSNSNVSYFARIALKNMAKTRAVAYCPGFKSVAYCKGFQHLQGPNALQ